ncbi:MAG: glycerol-3-phosphate dehydrogenase/oxidase [Chloroflexota bacterium]|mgnify:CR=1 FL=1
MTGEPSSASPGPLDDRRATIEDLAATEFDIVIVGGGIVGCGALLDATSRGLKAALVEQDDIASGTSGRSSRLIHGGLRYLEQLHFGLVAEALDERSRMLRLAPHLVRLEPFLFPIFGWPLVHQVFYGAGLLLYDLLGARREGGFARHLRPSGTRARTPSVRRRGLQGGIVYHDGVEDDARYTLAVLRTALARGARAVTRARVTGLIEADGRVGGVVVRDLLDDRTFEVRAQHVVDATGVWSAYPNGPLTGDGAAGILPSQGAHLVVRRDRIPSRQGVSLRVPGKVVFVIPWPDHWLIGTTDHAFDGAPERPHASGAEVDEILATVNEYFDVDLRRQDVLGTYAGLRPLVAPEGTASTVKASREHKVRREPNGLVRVGGGKYTTYRIMARDTIDAALGHDAARARPSGTADLLLVGAADRPGLDRVADALADRHGLTPDIAAALVDRHGTEASEVLELGQERDLNRRLGPEIRQLEAEVAWAVRRELALSLDDILSRRMRLSMVLRDRGASIAPRVAEIAGRDLGWDAQHRRVAVDAYLAGAHAEYDVPASAGGSAG